MKKFLAMFMMVAIIGLTSIGCGDEGKDKKKVEKAVDKKVEKAVDKTVDKAVDKTAK